MLLDELNRFARDGTVSATGAVPAADAARWIEACSQLLDHRIRTEREARYRRVTKHTRAIEAILDRSVSGQRKAAAVRTYLRTMSERERTEMISLRLVPGLLADRSSGPDMIRVLLRRAREQQRLWRRRLGSCPNVAGSLDAAIVPNRLFDRWQLEFEAIWRHAIRRCEYTPDCDVPGGRYFIGRSKECLKCRSRHSRVTGYRHRRKQRA